MKTDRRENEGEQRDQLINDASATSDVPREERSDVLCTRAAPATGEGEPGVSSTSEALHVEGESTPDEGDEGEREHAHLIRARGSTQPADAVSRPDGLVLLRMSEVTPESVEWLWPGRVPLGKLTLLVGEPEAGKTFLTLDFAARVSRGERWPDGPEAPRGNVILFIVEDGIADTIRPRLDALGADTERITVVKAVRAGGKQRVFTLDTDVPLLARAIYSEKARLVIVDPLNNYLGGKTNNYKDTDVRTILTPLAQMAERTRVAIVGIMHLTKNDEQALLHRVQGSIGFVAVARVVLTAKQNATDDGRRTLSVLKNNIAAKLPGLVYLITADGHLAWEGSAPNAAEAPPDATETEKAMQLLREQLAVDERPVAAVQAAVAAAGITRSALRKAKRALHLKPKRKGGFSGGAWVYSPIARARPASEPPSEMGEMDKMGEMDGDVAQPAHLDPPYIEESPDDAADGEPSAGLDKMAAGYEGTRNRDVEDQR